MKAVIDRFEGIYAVVLAGEEEIQLHIPKQELPPDANEGSWLTMKFELDHAGEQHQRQKMQTLLDKVKNKHR